MNKSSQITSSLLFMVLLWAGFSFTVYAQNGGFAGASTRIGFNARGMAMGNALSAVTSEGAYAYYNPAQAALFQDYKQVDLTAGILKFDRVYQSTGIQLQLPPTAGLAFSLLRAGIQDIDGRTESGYPTELFDLSEYQLASAFGIRLSDRMMGGIGLKFGLAQYQKDLSNAISLGIDFGLLYTLNDHMNLALSVKDLFASYSWDSKDLYNLDQSRSTVNNFPTRFIIGMAYQKETFTLSGDFEIQSYMSEVNKQEFTELDGEPTLFITTETINTHSKQLRLGASWKAHERITLRSGWQVPELKKMESWSFSSGFSLHLPFDIFSPSVDYAFVMEPYRISNMHIVSLRLNL